MWSVMCTRQAPQPPEQQENGTAMPAFSAASSKVSPGRTAMASSPSADSKMADGVWSLTAPRRGETKLSSICPIPPPRAAAAAAGHPVAARR